MYRNVKDISAIFVYWYLSHPQAIASSTCLPIIYMLDLVAQSTPQSLQNKTTCTICTYYLIVLWNFIFSSVTQ